MLPSDDSVILSQKLAAAEACIQSQAERINSFDILFDYLADKDPALAAILRRGSSTQTGQANANAPPVATAPEQQVANEETTVAALANLAIGSSPPSTVFSKHCLAFSLLSLSLEQVLVVFQTI